MPRAVPQFSKAQVDRAGRALIKPPGDGDSWSEWAQALAVVDNWRASHSFPLNTFGVWLRRHARGVDAEAVVAQRIKRLESIEAKLKRFQGLRLSQMQDIGGCRAVLQTRDEVSQLAALYKESELKHELLREDDYIAEPKKSGYRGVHLVYRYFSDRKTTYNNMLVEVQIRSRLQHAWATGVETVGTLLQQSLKASLGANEWLRFFSLMGSVIAIREDAPIIPGTPSDEGVLKDQVRQCAEALDVRNTLQVYGAALNIPQNPNFGKRAGNKYYLLELNPSLHTLGITGFPSGALEVATETYSRVERELRAPGAQAVLVSVDSLEALRAAYPNYFLDTELFVQILEDAVA